MHSGHRKRLDRKVLDKGIEKLEPHEQLEHILFAIIPRGDTNKIAHELLDRFVTVGGVLNADFEELLKVEGIGKRVAMFIKTLPSILGIVERNIVSDKLPILRTAEEIGNFVKTYFYGRVIEEAYLFSLNSAYRLIGVKKVSDGISGETGIYPSKVVKMAVSDNASMVIIAHNHPGGCVNPSVSDVGVAKKLAEVLSVVEIKMLDCVVVSGDEYFSMNGKGYLNPISIEYK